MPRSKIAQHALVTHMLEAENPKLVNFIYRMPGWHHRLGPPELVGDERHVPNRGAALRWVQAGSYRLPIHVAEPARPISEGTAPSSARGRVGQLARRHGLCERLIRFIGQI
jgi:hypothetical protein